MIRFELGELLSSHVTCIRGLNRWFSRQTQNTYQTQNTHTHSHSYPISTPSSSLSQSCARYTNTFSHNKPNLSSDDIFFILWIRRKSKMIVLRKRSVCAMDPWNRYPALGTCGAGSTDFTHDEKKINTSWRSRRHKSQTPHSVRRWTWEQYGAMR